MLVHYNIFKLESPDAAIIFIGSTTQNINRKLTELKSHYKKYIDGYSGFYDKAYDVLKFGSAQISLIERYSGLNRALINDRLKELCAGNRYYARQCQARSFVCMCGSTIERGSFKKHTISKKHTKFMN